MPSHPSEKSSALACPKCGSLHVRRSHRRGPVEYGRSISGLYPHRCRKCGHRFFHIRADNVRGASQSPVDRRKASERRRARILRRRREIGLYVLGFASFLLFLYWVARPGH